MFDIPATKSTPRVFYSEEDRIFSICGESYPENTFAFYEPVFAWLKQEFPGCDEIQFHFNISYMNSSSTKCILDILDIITEAYKRGCRISISWFYESENDRALDIAEEFEEDAEVPFTIIPLQCSETLV